MRKFLKKYKNSLGMKLGVFCASLIFCLAAAEIGLRLAGVAVTRSRERVFVPPYDEKYYDVDYTFERFRWNRSFERFRGGTGPLILTFGDSLTNGGNVKSYDSYPYHLFKHFADAGKSAAVYNMGYCEDSTFGVASKLKDFVRNNEGGRLPDAVVILVGAADLFNLPLVRERKLKDDSFWLDPMPAEWFYELRLYKVYRHIKMNFLLKRKLKKPGGGEITPRKKFEVLLEAYEEHKKSMGSDELKPIDPAIVERLNPFLAEDVRQYHMELGDVVDFTDLLVSYASIVYTARLAYDEFFGLLLDMVETFPEKFWTNYFDAGHYYLVQTYRVQSKYTAADVLKVLDKSAREHPDVARNEYFKNFRSIVADREEMDRYVDRKRLQAWDEIVRLCREKNIKIILQNYPVEYKSANRMLKTVSKKYGIPLIDNRARFAPLLKEKGRTKYIEDNDHLTPIGYKILAESVFAELEKAGLVSGR